MGNLNAKTHTAIFNWSLMIIGSSSAFFNLLTVAMFIHFRRKLLISNHNRILCSIALADAFVGFFALALGISLYSKSPRIVYKFIGNIPLFSSLFVSVASLSLLTVDRLIAVKKPFIYGTGSYRRIIYRVIFAIWIFSALITIQQYFIYIYSTNREELCVRSIIFALVFTVGGFALLVTNWVLFLAIRKYVAKIEHRSKRSTIESTTINYERDYEANQAAKDAQNNASNLSVTLSSLQMKQDAINNAAEKIQSGLENPLNEAERHHSRNNSPTISLVSLPKGQALQLVQDEQNYASDGHTKDILHISPICPAGNPSKWSFSEETLRNTCAGNSLKVSERQLERFSPSVSQTDLKMQSKRLSNDEAMHVRSNSTLNSPKSQQDDSIKREPEISQQILSNSQQENGFDFSQSALPKSILPSNSVLQNVKGELQNQRVKSRSSIDDNKFLPNASQHHVAHCFQHTKRKSILKSTADATTVQRNEMMGVTTAVVWKDLNNSTDNQGKRRRKCASTKNPDVKRTSLLCIFIVLVFILTWLPLASYRFGYAIGISLGIPWLRRFALCLAISNSLINPFAYYFLKRDFRLQFIQFLRCL